MPRISPLNHTFTKKLNSCLEISLKYESVPGNQDKFDCTLEFANAYNAESAVSTGNDQIDPDSARIDGDENQSNGKEKTGWLSSLWGSESAQLVEKEAPEVPLLLGYIQLLGYVRLNHQIGAETGTESFSAVYWKNHEYSNSYCSTDCDEKVQQILHTSLFKEKDEAGEQKTNKIGGIPDLHAKHFDQTANYLLHDLAHPFGTMDLPSSNAPPLSTHQQEELSSSLSAFVVPIYVTGQHLIFASTTILPGQKCVYKFRMDVPPETLPPSYNNKSTGSVGDAGLASIAYSVVVGVQEESGEQMKHRAVYFPMEFRPGHYGLDQRWFQHNYLQRLVFDKEWKPEKLQQSIEDRESLSGAERKNQNSQDTDAKQTQNYTKTMTPPPIHAGTDKVIPDKRKDQFLGELDSLIEGSLETVAATERRKSSASYISAEDRGLISQMPESSRVSYQIRVNNSSLCVLTMASAIYHVGDDVHFSIKLHPDYRTSSRVVGLTAHVEAHEIFHVAEERKVLNMYKVTPTIKMNTYADALMFPFAGDDAKTNSRASNFVSLPRYLTQQFQASTFMDLRYFMVFRFVLNDFPEMESYRLDEDPKAFAEYVSAYKLESEANEFKFSIPLTVLP